MSNRLDLLVITGSVRRGRFGPTAADWFARHARRAHDVVALDLAELTVPADLSGHPDVDTLAAAVDRADAVVIVTPEYNHSFPGPLKTAIDSLKAPWVDKPIGFVSYGGVSGGLRAVEGLRLVFEELRAVPVRDSVAFPNVWAAFDGDEPADPKRAARSADAMLGELAVRAGQMAGAPRVAA